MKYRSLVGVGLAAATVLVTPWNAVAATIPSPHPSATSHVTASATRPVAKSPSADKARKSPGAHPSSSKRVDPVINGCDFTVSGTTYTLDANCTATATIHVPDGVTLNGAGHTITVEGSFAGAVVENGGATMSIENLTVQGSNLSTATCNDILGIFFNNAGGSLTNVHVEGMTRHNGCQTGIGIRITATSAQTVTITGSTSSGSQKSELVASGPVTVNVSGSTFGPPHLMPGVIAQNTVQYSSGAGGTFTGNTVIGAPSGREDSESTGMIIFGASNLTVTNNTIGGAGTDIGIAVFDTTDATISGNHITVTPAPPGVPNHFGTIGVFVDENSSRVITTGNTFSGWEDNVIDARTEPYIVTTSPLPDGTVGTAYSALLEAIAEEQPTAAHPGSILTWSVIHGSLPPGLKLKNDAAVVGTPTQAGVFTFTLRVDDVIDGTSATREFTITIHPAHVSLHVTKTAFPNPAAAGQPVTFTITVSNGGPDNALGVTVDDALPASLSGFTWTCSASAAPSRCSRASGAGSISDSPVDVAAGGTVTFKVSGLLPADISGDLINDVTVTPAPGTISPDCTPGCSGSVTVPVGPALPVTGPDLLPEAAAGTGLIALGGLILLPTWRRRRRGAASPGSRA